MTVRFTLMHFQTHDCLAIAVKCMIKQSFSNTESPLKFNLLCLVRYSKLMVNKPFLPPHTSITVPTTRTILLVLSGLTPRHKLDNVDKITNLKFLYSSPHVVCCWIKCKGMSYKGQGLHTYKISATKSKRKEQSERKIQEETLINSILRRRCKKWTGWNWIGRSNKGELLRPY